MSLSARISKNNSDRLRRWRQLDGYPEAWLTTSILLGVIIGYGEIVQEGTPADDSLRSCVDEMLKAGHRAAGLTQQSDSLSADSR